MSAGIHTIYIEGWGRTSILSFAAALQRIDWDVKEYITAASSPNAKINQLNTTFFKECDPAASSSNDNNFTLCGFKADDDVDLKSVEDVLTYYASV